MRKLWVGAPAFRCSCSLWVGPGNGWMLLQRWEAGRSCRVGREVVVVQPLGALPHPKSGSTSYRQPRCREPQLVSDQQAQPGACTHPTLDVVAELQSNSACQQAVRLPTCCRAVTRLPNLVGGCEQAGACYHHWGFRNWSQLVSRNMPCCWATTY